MTDRVAFVGDIHGNLDALLGISATLDSERIGARVFLGDYINRGPASREVVEVLMSMAADPDVVVLRGNHEDVLLSALESGDVASLLRVGGALTIRSYVGGNVAPDVATALREAVPQSHVDFMREMPTVAAGHDWIASHERIRASGKYAISAHVDVGVVPVIRSQGARIDTGCDGSGGRLTAFIWPSRTYFQVGADGVAIIG